MWKAPTEAVTSVGTATWEERVCTALEATMEWVSLQRRGCGCKGGPRTDGPSGPRPPRPGRGARSCHHSAVGHLGRAGLGLSAWAFCRVRLNGGENLPREPEERSVGERVQRILDWPLSPAHLVPTEVGISAGTGLAPPCPALPLGSSVEEAAWALGIRRSWLPSCPGARGRPRHQAPSRPGCWLIRAIRPGLEEGPEVWLSG